MLARVARADARSVVFHHLIVEIAEMVQLRTELRGLLGLAAVEATSDLSR